MLFGAFFGFLMVEFGVNTIFGTKAGLSIFNFLSLFVSPTFLGKLFFVFLCFLPFLPLLSMWVSDFSYVLIFFWPKGKEKVILP